MVMMRRHGGLIPYGVKEITVCQIEGQHGILANLKRAVQGEFK